jgi:hypothetical protein
LRVEFQLNAFCEFHAPVRTRRDQMTDSLRRGQFIALLGGAATLGRLWRVRSSQIGYRGLVFLGRTPRITK